MAGTHAALALHVVPCMWASLTNNTRAFCCGCDWFVGCAVLSVGHGVDMG
jgi:hypothetical protein